MGAPDFFETCITPAAQPVAMIVVGVLLVVILVIFLGVVEGAGPGDLDGHRLAELFLDGAPGLLRRLLLRVISIENGGPVLVAAVAELSVLGEGIDVVPENL